VPLPNIFLTRLFSKRRLKRKDFQEILRLPWAQEAPGSPDAWHAASTINVRESPLRQYKFGWVAGFAEVIEREETLLAEA
jgi:hypothetical protein